MRNIAFVIWMVGISISSAFQVFVYEYLLKRQYSEGVEIAATIIEFILIIIIGVLLYEKK